MLRCASRSVDINPEGIAKARQDIRAWLGQPIDWQCLDDVPIHVGPQGLALAYFENLRVAHLEALGIDLVYGDRPGSTYYAAELRNDIDDANDVALALGLNTTFVQAPARTVNPPSPPEVAACAPPSYQAMANELAWRLPPTFGVGYSEWAGTADDRAEQHTVPMPSLRHLHSREVFACAWIRLLDALRNPIREWIDPAGVKHVSVLGTGIYSVDREGLIAVRLWEVGAHGYACLDVTPSLNVSLDTLPFQWAWLDRIERGFAADLAGLHPEADRSKVQEYAAWAFKVFRRRIKGGCDMRLIRGRIRQAMCLDPLAMEIARRSNLLAQQRWLPVPTYNRVIRHIAAHRKLQLDAPRLAPLFDRLCEERDFPADGEPLQRLKQYLLAQGLSQRCWRMVVRSSSQLLRPVAAFYRSAAASAVVDYLRLVDQMHWSKQPSRAFMQTVLALRGRPGALLVDYSRQYDEIMTILRGIRESFERGDDEHRRHVVQGLSEVLDWVDLEGADATVRQRQHLNWSWLARSARAWSERRLVEHRQGSKRWPAPSAGMTIGEFTVTFIDNAVALHDEAMAMRHCAFDYVQRCATGKVVIASMARRGRRVATAMWSVSDGAWRVAQVSGPSNRAPGQELLQIAGLVATKMNARAGQAPLAESRSPG